MMILKGNADLVPAEHATLPLPPPKLTELIERQLSAVHAGDMDLADHLQQQIAEHIRAKRDAYVKCA